MNRRKRTSSTYHLGEYDYDALMLCSRCDHLMRLHDLGECATCLDPPMDCDDVVEFVSVQGLERVVQLAIEAERELIASQIEETKVEAEPAFSPRTDNRPMKVAKNAYLHAAHIARNGSEALRQRKNKTNDE